MKGKTYRYGCTLLAVFIFALTSGELCAQEQRFNAGIMAGLTASQIRGDLLHGWNKLGLQAGLRGTAYLSSRSELNIELLYSQHGSREPNNAQAGGTKEINLNFIKVPVMWHFKDWYQEDEDFYRVHFTAGLYYSNLISADVEGFAFSADDFNSTEIGFILGANYFINPHIGVIGRYGRSITMLYSNENIPDFSALIPLNLTFAIIYMF